MDSTPQRTSSLRKKLKIAVLTLGSFLGVLLLAVAVIPFFVDVDQYRPWILERVNSRIHGHLELGKLRLSLWKGIQIQAEGLNLQDDQKRPLLSVSDVSFSMPYASVLQGAPSLTLEMRNPSVSLRRDSDGKINWIALFSTGPVDATSPPTSVAPTGQAKPAAQATVSLPPIVFRSRLGVRIHEGVLSYQDLKAGQGFRLEAVALDWADISLERPMSLKARAQLDASLPSGIKLREPLSLQAGFQVLPETLRGELEAALGSQGLAARLRGKFSLAKQESPQQVQSRWEIDGIELAAWSRLAPPTVVALQPRGRLQAAIALEGSAAKLGYSGQIELKGFSIQHPLLRGRPEWNAKARLKTDQIESFEATLQAPPSDFRITGSIESLQKPVVRVKVASQRLNVDQFWVRATTETPGQTQSPTALELTSLQGAGSSSEGQAQWDSVEFQVFGGKIRTEGSVGWDQSPPVYRFSLQGERLDLRQAVASRFPLFKNTILGRATFEFQGEGKGFDPQTALAQLNGRGRLAVQEGVLNTIDGGKLAAEAASSALRRLGERLPLLKGKTLAPPRAVESRYDSIAATFTIQQGLLNAPDFVAKAKPGQGIDLKGKTKVGLQDLSLRADWELIDSSGISGAADLGVEVAGISVPRILVEGKVFRLPVSVGCTVLQPCLESGKSVEFLAGVVGKNLARATGAAGAKVRTQLERNVEDALKKASPQLQKKIQGTVKDLKKKFLKGW